jgi:ribonuclease-3
MKENPKLKKLPSSIFGITFQQPRLLLQALTHKSFANENPPRKSLHLIDNERLEFLGDAVLDLCVSEWLLELFSHESEGYLTKCRATWVNQTALATLARSLELESLIRLGKGVNITDMILASTLEAIIGAYFLDQGPLNFIEVRKFVRWVFDTHGKEIKATKSLKELEDFKSQLQEWCQKHFQALPKYQFITSEGPDHQKVFTFTVSCLGQPLGLAQGHSKQLAQKLAAQQALEKLKNGG